MEPTVIDPIQGLFIVSSEAHAVLEVLTILKRYRKLLIDRLGFEEYAAKFRFIYSLLMTYSFIESNHYHDDCDDSSESSVASEQSEDK